MIRRLFACAGIVGAVAVFTACDPLASAAQCGPVQVYANSVQAVCHNLEATGLEAVVGYRQPDGTMRWGNVVRTNGETAVVTIIHSSAPSPTLWVRYR